MGLLPVANIRTRIAPTPSGFLHPGNGLSFVLTWLLARSDKGKIVLRIDDLDQQRFRHEYLEDIFRTLEWLGIDYDEGPSGPEDFSRHFSQIHRIPLYREALKKLREKSVVYSCECSRKEIRQNAIIKGIYAGTCRKKIIPLDETNTAWRIALPASAKSSFKEWKTERQNIELTDTLGDFVIRKKDGFPAYQIGSVVDDLYWNINFVVRGADLLHATAAQCWLADLLKETRFSDSVFWHHPLLKNENGEKLSKSKGSGSLKSWREQGRSPEAIYQLAARFLELPAETANSLEEMFEAFVHLKKHNEI